MPIGVQRPAITKHLKNIFESGELKENSVSSILEHTTQHGAIEGKTQTQPVKFYNLDYFLKFNEQDILTNTGNIRHEVAQALALGEYEKFKKIQDKNYISDFDREVKKIDIHRHKKSSKA